MLREHALAVPFPWPVEALMVAFPDYLPYDGAFRDIVPHVAVAQDELDERACGDHWRDGHAFEL